MFFGIAVVAAGIIFLGSAFGFWEISELSGWWTVFIIVPAIGSMIASGLDLLNVAAFAVGVWLLIKCNPPVGTRRAHEPFRYRYRACHGRLLADIQHRQDEEAQKASR